MLYSTLTSHTIRRAINRMRISIPTVLPLNTLMANPTINMANPTDPGSIYAVDAFGAKPNPHHFFHLTSRYFLDGRMIAGFAMVFATTDMAPVSVTASTC